MANAVSNQLRRIPPRHISGAGQVMLGIATLLTTATPGTTYAFVGSTLGVPIPGIAIAFILSGIIMGLTSSKALYLIAASVLFVFGLLAIWGLFRGETSLQGAIIYFILGAHALRAFPENGEANGQ